MRYSGILRGLGLIFALLGITLNERCHWVDNAIRVAQSPCCKSSSISRKSRKSNTYKLSHAIANRWRFQRNASYVKGQKKRFLTVYPLTLQIALCIATTLCTHRGTPSLSPAGCEYTDRHARIKVTALFQSWRLRSMLEYSSANPVCFALFICKRHDRRHTCTTAALCCEHFGFQQRLRRQLR